MSEHPTQAPRSSETVKKEKSNLDYTCLVSRTRGRAKLELLR